MRRRQRPEAVSPEEAVRARRTRAVQTGLWALTILLQMGIVKCLEVRAETGAGKASELTVRYGIEEAFEDCTQPDGEYEDEDGVFYELERWSAVPVTVPPLTRKVQKEILYEQIEGVTALPDSIEITARDEERGQTATAVCPAEEQETVREEWQDGFVFTVTFHTYEAGYYELADRLIPYNDERPELEGCGELLLELAGLSPEDYRVTHVQWSGEAYQDEEGNRCRDASAFGQKRLRDYRVTYSGTAVFPEKKGWQTVAVYRLPQEETGTEETFAPATARASEPRPLPEEMEQPGDIPAKQPLTLWQRITRTLMITIAAGTALFLGGLLLLAILRVVKKLRSCYNRRKMKSNGG